MVDWVFWEGRFLPETFYTMLSQVGGVGDCPGGGDSVGDCPGRWGSVGDCPSRGGSVGDCPGLRGSVDD